MTLTAGSARRLSYSARMPRDRLNVLFVCSRNQWRSPTAEQVWRRHPQLNVRSGGTSPSARHTVSDTDIDWADEYKYMDPELVELLEQSVGSLLNIE